MTDEEKPARPDDYVIFRRGGMSRLEFGAVPPQEIILWMLAVAASVVGGVMAPSAVGPGVVHEPWLLFIAACLLFLGLGSFVAALAVGAVLRAFSAAPKRLGAEDTDAAA